MITGANERDIRKNLAESNDECRILSDVKKNRNAEIEMTTSTDRILRFIVRTAPVGSLPRESVEDRWKLASLLMISGSDGSCQSGCFAISQFSGRMIVFLVEGKARFAYWFFRSEMEGMFKLE